jgi:putative ABC transport system permease protein
MLSVPLSWYALSAWLVGFAYRVDLTIGLFIAGGLITFMLSMISIVMPSLQAARQNAVNVLKATD